MAEQNNELLMKIYDTHPNGYAPFPEVNAKLSMIHIFMVIVVALVLVVLGIMVVDMIIKETSKRHFIIKSGTIMRKWEKKM